MQKTSDPKYNRNCGIKRAGESGRNGRYAPQNGKGSGAGRRRLVILLTLLALAAVMATGWLRLQKEPAPVSSGEKPPATAEGTNYPEYLEGLSLPDYEPGGAASTEVNGNVPFFDLAAERRTSYEYYGELDRLGRCTYAEACIGTDLMPEAERGDISTVRPTGWHNTVYDFIEDGFLYNRCHLIAFMLTGENDNAANLITGTRYLNTEGMLPAEAEVARYVRRTGNHVHYRATPVFDGNDLLAAGVLLEARSVEDNGAGLCFCIYCFNVQPGVEIDYATGANRTQ